MKIVHILMIMLMLIPIGMASSENITLDDIIAGNVTIINASNSKNFIMPSPMDKDITPDEIMAENPTSTNKTKTNLDPKSDPAVYWSKRIADTFLEIGGINESEHEAFEEGFPEYYYKLLENNITENEAYIIRSSLLTLLSVIESLEEDKKINSTKKAAFSKNVKEILEWMVYDETNKKIYANLIKLCPGIGDSKAKFLSKLGDDDAAIECLMQSALAYSHEMSIQSRKGDDEDGVVQALRASIGRVESAYALMDTNIEGHYVTTLYNTPNYAVGEDAKFYEGVNSSELYLIQFDSMYNLDDGENHAIPGYRDIFYNEKDKTFRTFKNVYLELSVGSDAVPGNLFEYFVKTEKEIHAIENVLATGVLTVDGYSAEYVIGEAFDSEYTDRYGYVQKRYTPAGVLYIQINENTSLKIIVVDIDNDILDIFKSIQIDVFSLNSSSNTEKTKENATKLVPKLALAWYDAGYTLYEIRKYDEAIECFDEAIKLDPKYADAWNDKGNALRGQGKYDEAIKSLDEAIKLNPKLAYVWYNKGNALYKQDKYEEALNAYDEAIRINPDYARAWYNKGITTEKLNRTTESDAAYAKAKELGYEG